MLLATSSCEREQARGVAGEVLAAATASVETTESRDPATVWDECLSGKLGACELAISFTGGELRSQSFAYLCKQDLHKHFCEPESPPNAIDAQDACDKGFYDARIMASSPERYSNKYELNGVMAWGGEQKTKLCKQGLSPLSCLSLHRYEDALPFERENTKYMLSVMAQWTAQSPSARIVSTVMREKSLHGHWDGEESAGRLLCETDWAACRFADDLKPKYWQALADKVSGTPPAGQ